MHGYLVKSLPIIALMSAGLCTLDRYSGHWVAASLDCLHVEAAWDDNTVLVTCVVSMYILGVHVAYQTGFDYI